MRALCNLGKILIRPREVVGVHPYIQDNPKYFPWFAVRNPLHIISVVDG
jgi:hypothetical protein